MKYPVSSRAIRTGLTAFLLTASGGMASAKSVSYTYYRFRATALRTPPNLLIQFSELDLFNSAGATPTSPLVPTSAADSTNNNSGDGAPANAIDIGNRSTKWLNKNYTNGFLIVGFSAPTTIDSYNFYTGNDATERDPVSWVLEGSNDQNTWTIVDVETNNVPTTSRSALAFPTNLVLPDQPKAVINDFEFSDSNQSTIVKNNTAVGFLVDAQAPSVSIVTTPGGASTPVTDSFVQVTPPSNTLATITLTAHSTGGDATKALQVRTVPAPTLSYRYVRFTPTKLFSGRTIAMDDFSFQKAGVAVPVVAVENPAGNAAATTPVTNLIDDPAANFGTTYVATMSPVIFDFGAAAVSYDSYAFSTGPTTNIGGRPLQWLLEGSNDKSTWTLLSNVNFDFNTPAAADTETQDIPFDGSAVLPYVTLSSDTQLAASGAPLNLSYSVLGATSGTINPGNITVSGTGTKVVNPTASTVYTLTATTTAGTAQATVSQSVVASIAASFNYTNFNDSSLIQPTGVASVLVDNTFTAAGQNNKRIRLTPNATGQNGGAWYTTPVIVNQGFDTSYDAFLENPTSALGSDGIGFVIQNSSTGASTVPNNQIHISTNAVSVTLDGFPDSAGESGFASLEILKNDTLALNVPLPALGLAHGGTYLPDFNNPAASPYHVRIIYTPPLTTGASGAMTVYVDSVKVVDNFAITLEDAGAVDANGKAYIGFVARTGSFTEFQDITAWSFLSAGPSAATTPLVITSSAFDTTAHSVTLNYSATSGKTYRVTSSTDLATWTQVSGTINTVATSAAGTFSFSYTPGAKAFYRVELVP